MLFLCPVYTFILQKILNNKCMMYYSLYKNIKQHKLFSTLSGKSERFLKYQVALKTGVMMLKIQLCITRKSYVLNYTLYANHNFRMAVVLHKPLLTCKWLQMICGVSLSKQSLNVDLARKIRQILAMRIYYVFCTACWIAVRILLPDWNKLII